MKSIININNVTYRLFNSVYYAIFLFEYINLRQAKKIMSSEKELLKDLDEEVKIR